MTFQAKQYKRYSITGGGGGDMLKGGGGVYFTISAEVVDALPIKNCSIASNKLIPK